MDDTEPLEPVLVEPAATPVAAPRRDPVTTGLLVLVLTLIVALLATTAGLYVYLTTLNKAPRTSAERDVASAEAATREQPDSTNSWIALAYAYAAAGRTDEALATARRGERTSDGEFLSLVRADILRNAKRYADAVKEYNRAERLVKKMYARHEAERKKRGIVADVKDDALVRVYWGRGLAKREIGDLDGAIKDLNLALKEQPTQADLLVNLGDLYAEKKQPDRARAAYQAALKFIPDMPAALEGLERLGEGGK